MISTILGIATIVWFFATIFVIYSARKAIKNLQSGADAKTKQLRESQMNDAELTKWNIATNRSINTWSVVPWIMVLLTIALFLGLALSISLT